MRIHWIWLAEHPALKDMEKVRLAQYFADPEELYFAAPDDSGLPEELRDAVAKAVSDRSLEEAEKILEQCGRENLSILTFGDDRYPHRLKHIPDPPLVLYCRGNMPDLEQRPAIGVVGTRKASAYGLNLARKLGYQVGKCGAIVVSGLAKGIDALAMEGALTAGVPVIGVLGCGAEQVYPKSNRELFRDTQAYGCILSEYPPGSPPLGWHFPQRNRIISGLSNGVLVVEAPKGSGALITARRAGEQGRDVFVIPGNVDLPSFEGNYNLLREGATPVRCGWDLVGEYEALYPETVHEDPSQAPGPAFPKSERAAAKAAQEPLIPQKSEAPQKSFDKKVIDKEPKPPYIDVNKPKPKLTAEETQIVEALRGGERLVDDVIAETGISTGKMLAVMTMLELKGVLKRLPGKRLRLN